MTMVLSDFVTCSTSIIFGVGGLYIGWKKISNSNSEYKQIVMLCIIQKMK